MKRSERIGRIANINQSFENVAGASLSAAQAQYQNELNQLEQLKVYRNDYQSMLKERMKLTVSPKEMQDYQYFFSSLEIAIAQQEEVVNQCLQEMDSSKQNWLGKHMDTQKMYKVKENLKSEETEAECKKEIEELNEINQSRYNSESKHSHH